MLAPEEAVLGGDLLYLPKRQFSGDELVKTVTGDFDTAPNGAAGIPSGVEGRASQGAIAPTRLPS